VLNIPGPNGTIIVKGSFELRDIYKKEFHKMAQTFGMTIEYARLRGETDHNILPNMGRSLPDQAFDSTRDAKKVRVHPVNPNKTTSVASDLTST
jgi:hypothetical protein